MLKKEFSHMCSNLTSTLTWVREWRIARRGRMSEGRVRGSKMPMKKPG